MPLQEKMQKVRGWIQSAQRVVALTGAGISAESGVPTFRDAQTGLWARYKPEDLATEAAFRHDPQRVWDWYAWRRELVANVSPNAAHHALAEFGRQHPGRLTLVTQNVDGLHQQAGSEDVLALHGNIRQDRWLRPCPRERFSERDCEPATATDGRPPKCDVCGNQLRPAVVWFGEALPEISLFRADEAAGNCDLMLVIGTSGLVYPAAGLADVARRAGARVVIINTGPTELDELADCVIRCKAAECLPELLLGEARMAVNAEDGV